MLAFVQAGRVAEIMVRQGDAVEEDRVLARLDDEVERIRVEQLRAKAEDTFAVSAAEAKLQQTEADLKKFEWALREKAGSQWEVEHARLEVKIARLTLQLRQFEQAQSRRALREAEAQLARMQLRSPVRGTVERVTIEPGETVEPLKPVIRVVRIDPLWADVPVPRALATQLKAGQEADVAFAASASEEGPGGRGRVIHVAAVADAASNTLTVRVEAPNPAKRPAGEHVRVRFPGAAPSPTPAPTGKPGEADTPEREPGRAP